MAAIFSQACSDDDANIPQSPCNPVCSNNETCNLTSGMCVPQENIPDACQNKREEGQTCNETTGQCDETLAENICKKNCKDGQICNQNTGECVTNECAVPCTDETVCNQGHGTCGCDKVVVHYLDKSGQRQEICAYPIFNAKDLKSYQEKWNSESISKDSAFVLKADIELNEVVSDTSDWIPFKEGLNIDVFWGSALSSVRNMK